MSLPSKTQATFVSDMVAAWAQQLGFQPTLPKGDPLLATFQAVAAQAVFLQALVQVVNGLTLAQTRTGADLDAWMAQFRFTRLPAAQAAGPVTFGKAAPATAPVPIPAGTIVQTQGGAIQYQAVADTSQPTWNPGQNAYVLPIGASSLTATVQATLAGAAYNVTAGQLSQIASNVPGIDTVTNPAPITSGQDAESDAAFLNRFVNYLNSLSKATYGAIVSAIQGVQQGIRGQPVENVNVALAPLPGAFVVAVDNGAGAAPASLVAAVQATLETTRAFTVQAQTIAAAYVAPSVALTVRLAPGFLLAQIMPAVQNAVAAAANAVPIGGGVIVGNAIDGAGFFYISTIEEAALSVPGVLSVQPGQTLIAGVNADFALSKIQAINIAASGVTVGQY